jgi:protein-S-isoprenylcysteine O-methyltransferase Ste14
MPLSPKFALFTLLSTLFYLCLPIIGWGGIGAFLAHPALIALILITFALAASALFTTANLNPGEREDRANRWVLAVFGIIGLLSGWLPAYTDRLNFLTLDGTPTRWLGVALYAAGGALRMWPVFILGNRFSGLVAIQPGHSLVTTGIYCHIRNPSYLGLLINAIGWALAFRSSLGVLLALCYLPPLIARMQSEETLLQSQFGAQYTTYRDHSWRLVPGLY